MTTTDLDTPGWYIDFVLNGKSTRSGEAAALISLCSKGFVDITENQSAVFGLRLTKDSIENAENVGPVEKYLYRWLQKWTKEPSRYHSALSTEWSRLILYEAVEGNLIDSQLMTKVTQRLWFPAWVRWSWPGADRAHWKSWAKKIKSDDPLSENLPESREEWDRLFILAMSLGQVRYFLENVRFTCEYYARHYQGIVMTFYTPRWFVRTADVSQERFAYLTEGLLKIFGDFSWSRFTPITPMVEVKK